MQSFFIIRVPYTYARIIYLNRFEFLIDITGCNLCKLSVNSDKSDDDKVINFSCRQYVVIITYYILLCYIIYLYEQTEWRSYVHYSATNFVLYTIITQEWVKYILISTIYEANVWTLWNVVANNRLWHYFMYNAKFWKYNT